MHKFIPVGPVDGFWHVCYQIAGTKVYSSVCLCTSEKAALDECEWLNACGESFDADDVITETR